MPIYRYPESDLIERIELTHLHGKKARATIRLQAGATPEQIEKLRGKLGECECSVLVDMAEGRPVLEVRGIHDENPFLAAIRSLGPGTHKVKKEMLPNEASEKTTLGDLVYDNSLFLSALFYDLGNVAFFASGMQRGRHNKGGIFTANDRSEIMIGGAFSVGDLLMTFFGKEYGDEELRAASKGLKEYLTQKGVALPQGEVLDADALHQSGIMQHTDAWLRKNIVHIKCLSEFAGGLFTIHSALKPGERNNGKLAAGLLISTGWLTTFLLEKAPGHSIFDGNKPAPDRIGSMMAANPRGWIARPLGMGNNIANLWGSLNPYTGERTRYRSALLDAQQQVKLNPTGDALDNLARAQAKQHDYGWNVLSACSFLIAHSLFGLSGSKRPPTSQDDEVMMNDLVLLSANLLAQQPALTREKTIEDTADYISKLSHVRLEKDELAGRIHDKITTLAPTGWLKRVQPRLAQQNAPSFT